MGAVLCSSGVPIAAVLCSSGAAGRDAKTRSRTLTHFLDHTKRNSLAFPDLFFVNTLIKLDVLGHDFLIEDDVVEAVLAPVQDSFQDLYRASYRIKSALAEIDGSFCQETGEKMQVFAA